MHQPQNASRAGFAAARRRLPLLRCAAIIGLWLVPAAGQCFTWDYVPTISTGVRYETNPDYIGDNDLEDDAFAGFVDGTIDITGETQLSRLSFRPRVRVSGYKGSENDSELDAVDYYAPLSGTWTSERSQYGINAGYSQVSTRDSEVRVSDPNNPGQPGSSGRIVVVDEDQERWYAAPFATFLVTPGDSLGVTVSFDDVTYTEAALTNRSNYEYGRATGSWTHTLGPKSRVSGSVNVDGFRATQPDSPVENETISYGFDAGYEYSLSARTTLGITAGTSRSDISVSGLAAIDDDQNPTTPPIACFGPQQGVTLCELESNEKNFVGEVFIRQQAAETITTELTVSRSIQPNSDGAQVTQDIARGYISKQFSSRWSGSVGATYIRQEAVGADVAGSLAQRFDRDYIQFQSGLSRRLARTWWVDANYYFTSDEQKSGVSYTTTNHVISLQLRYAGLGSH